jgi:hypothetical protein
VGAANSECHVIDFVFSHKMSDHIQEKVEFEQRVVSFVEKAITA